LKSEKLPFWVELRKTLQQWGIKTKVCQKKKRVGCGGVLRQGSFKEEEKNKATLGNQTPSSADYQLEGGGTFEKAPNMGRNEVTRCLLGIRKRSLQRTILQSGVSSRSRDGAKTSSY